MLRSEYWELALKQLRKVRCGDLVLALLDVLHQQRTQLGRLEGLQFLDWVGPGNLDRDLLVLLEIDPNRDPDIEEIFHGSLSLRDVDLSLLAILVGVGAGLLLLSAVPHHVALSTTTAAHHGLGALKTPGGLPPCIYGI